MPVDFLTERQRRAYARFDGEPSDDELSGCFHFDEDARALIAKRRGAHCRLGFAIQLGTVRFLGTFLDNPTDVPDSVIRYTASEIGITDIPSLTGYAASETRWDHADVIRRHYGYRHFTSRGHLLGFLRWLYTRAWLNGERPGVLFEMATIRLIKAKVLLPGISVLAKLIAKTRSRTSARLWRTLAALPSHEQKARLDSLLAVPDDAHQSNLDRLRHEPTRVSGPSLIQALERVAELSAFEVGDLDLTAIPPIRLKALARSAACSTAQAIRRMGEDRRISTLLAFCVVFAKSAMDDAMDVFDLLVTDIMSEAEKAGKRSRLRTIGDLDAAALKLRDACRVILDRTCPSNKVRHTVWANVPRETLDEATKTVGELARPAGHNYRKELVDCYGRVRVFLPALLHHVDFRATTAGRDTLHGVCFLADADGKLRRDFSEAPKKMISRSWRPFVCQPENEIDRRSYTICALERLQQDLHRRDIFVPAADRWSDPRSRLLDGDRWKAVKTEVCRAAGRRENPEEELQVLSKDLDEAYRRTVDSLPDNDDVRVEKSNGKDTLTVANLDKLPEPDSLASLRACVHAMLPIVDMPQMLLEIHAQTGFADQFNHVCESEAHVNDLHVSICAVLLAESCNIGLDPVAREDVPALTRRRLLWVQQNYIRAETIAAANSVLVRAQSEIPLVKLWGGGEVASADGLRFSVPVRTIHARHNPKYFKTQRGLTWYELTSDQYTGLGGTVIPGTLRDSMYILEVLLGQDTCLRPLEIMTDTAGASDVVFALFWLLGYRFSPRLADVGESRFWRMDSDADYGALNGLARNKINTKLISDNWDDILRVTGSLQLGAIAPSELVRTLLRPKRPSTLTRAIREVGRISKTIYQLNYVNDQEYRRRILTQLNRGEERWGVARTICFGRRGEIRRRYREGQEAQLGALGLTLNASVLWQTLYIDQALRVLAALGKAPNEDDVARLSPLIHANLHVLGRYSFDLAPEVASGKLRPLRPIE